MRLTRTCIQPLKDPLKLRLNGAPDDSLYLKVLARATRLCCIEESRCEFCIRARLQPGRRVGHMLIPEPLQGRHRG